MSGEEEQWRSVADFPGYEVSDHGRVRSWWTARLKGGHRGERAVGSVPLVLTATPVSKQNGHLRVGVHRGGRARTVFVHRLVLEAFVGPRPSGMLCRHFPDRDPANNRLSNLQWGTPKENSDDSRVHGTLVKGCRQGAHTKPESRRHEDAHGMAKLTVAKVASMRMLLALGASANDCASWFGVSRSCAYFVREGHTWTRSAGGPGLAKVHRDTEPHHNAKLTAAKVANAKLLVALGASQRDCASWFGVTASTLRGALTGKTWRAA